MGKTTSWFRGLLGGKKAGEFPARVGSSEAKPVKEKKRWSFVRSLKDKKRTVPQQVIADERRGSYREGSSSSYLDGVDPNNHAIAVAAATAAVAEAAVAAAKAAAAVVMLTRGGRPEEWAAVKIQASFRGYLARRALRALKGLVKLQAVVRGHIVRKQMADTMRRMQALVRVQVRARAGRALLSGYPHSSTKYSLFHHPGPATPEKYEHSIRAHSTKRDGSSTLKRNSRDIIYEDKTHQGWNCLDHWLDERRLDRQRDASIRTVLTDDDKSDKILEVDTGKPHFNSKPRNAFQSSQHVMGLDRNTLSFTTMNSPSKDSTTAQHSDSSTSSGEVQSLRPLKFPREIDDTTFFTADNSPQFSALSRPGSAKRGPFTPTKSDCSRSILSGYSDHPSYMGNTESSRAKVRSQSAPKQRLVFEKSSSTRRYTVQGFGDARSSAERVSALHANFISKAYPGSGRLNRLGMPVHGDTDRFNGVYPNRY
ncbi:hypothetical protein HHK36_027790 [Tetracentron sinense]|uniref:DUF4005 domain-containing protein n=1 Tax=Tetracentron sinense TaxID=13715 RepID=A0A835D4R0_TETSI|nr:hypothetical protein HHK36_027790 [Tetracentron sinense]